jgi:beta-lactam-binding protein with PASTA domain
MARPVPADLEDALASSPAARERFWTMPADRKDAWVRWVERARLPRARRRRIGETVRRLAGSAGAVETENVAAPPLPRSDAGAWFVVLAALAAVAAFLVWFTVYRHDDGSKSTAVVVTAKATVPRVDGIRYQSALFQLKEAKLASRMVRRAAAKPRGIVIGQKPKAGTSVPQGTPVALVVSNGPPGVKMPDVAGLAAADAVKALQARKLVPALDQVTSQEAPGTVVSQRPPAGARAKPGTKVVLGVAKGAAAVPAPDVTGQSDSQAAAALRRAGLSARLVQVPSAQPKGTVVAQSPAPGQKVAKGGTVRLNVSSGARSSPTTTTATTTTATTTSAATTTARQTTTAPAGNDYSGLRLQTAVQRIAQGRQKVIVQYVSSSKPVGVVVSSSTAGSRERLQVSAGPDPKPATSVPDVTGEDSATARQDLQAAGFTAIEVQWPVSDPASESSVVYETPAGQAPEGSAIVIYVGSVS